MQFFTTLLAVSTFVASAIAAPAASLPNGVAARDDASGFLSGVNVGQGTWYSTGLGSCGVTNTDSDYIAAVSHILYDGYPGYTGGNPNSNGVCGRKINAKYQGKSVTVTVSDRCAACGETDLDFSPAAFSQLADPSVGRLSGMTWTWA
ncbi:plant expansin [Gloeopeniophorella convolvens]|nr:plant expansin [Gloeopeniophorella convolvens]